MRGLRNVSEVAARIPFIDGHHGSRPVALARGIVFVQRPVELVRIGGITYHAEPSVDAPFVMMKLVHAAAVPTPMVASSPAAKKNFLIL